MDRGECRQPTADILDQQAKWLVPARARLLRRAGIARRHSVLDLGCGCGSVTEDLTRRCGGRVVAVDCRKNSMIERSSRFAGAAAICANAKQLPFRNGSFDLVFSQFALLWMNVSAAVGEIRRVLVPGGVLVALEPDYGGMIEHPPEIATRDVWLAALARAGADPYVGRKLPSFLAGAGLTVNVELLDRLPAPSPLRFDLLAGLPLSEPEDAVLRRVRQADVGLSDSTRVVHLPMFLILAEAPND